jgi:hypothetical protein
MQAEFLLSVFFELLLEVVDEDGETACSVSGRSDNGDGLVAGWPKLAERKTKSGDTAELESRRETWQWQHRGRVSLFIAERYATVIPTD